MPRKPPKEPPSIKRVRNACTRCRNLKVRCSGTSPCTRCERKKETCVFEAAESRVSVTRSYLRSLESRRWEEILPISRTDIPKELAPLQAGHSSSGDVSHPRDSQTEPQQLPQILPRIPNAASNLSSPYFSRHAVNDDPAIETTETEFAENPLTSSNETFAVGSDGKHWFLGPTSSWSFCRRVISLISSYLPQETIPPDPWTLTRLDLKLSPIRLDEQPVIDDLPGQDYATFLAHTVKYHLGALSPIIDDEIFFEKVSRFYRDPVVEAQGSRFWYAQFLLVLAFGEAITKGGSSPTVSGINYASRALSLIPPFICVDKDSITVVETLCLAGLYLQSLDMRLEAFQMIGQALRMCTLEGFHRHASPAEVGDRQSRRCNILFWTTYILDRHFATWVGAPSSIRDEDITAKLPFETVDSSWTHAMTLHVRLSRLTTEILAGVYGVDSEVNGVFLKKTQQMLHRIAHVSRDLDRFMQNNVSGTTIRSSKVATRLLLSYHHCIVLTTRPLVMCVLQKRLAHGNRGGTAPSEPVSRLLKTCIESVSNVLGTLKELGDNDHLDCFIPFQLEEAFSSAFLLHVIASVVPDWVPDRSYLAVSYLILNKMITKGSHGAWIRKMELQRLEDVFLAYSQTSSQEENMGHNPSDGPARQFDPVRNMNQFGARHSTGPQPYRFNEHAGDWNFSLQDSFADSGNGLHMLAEELGLQSFI